MKPLHEITPVLIHAPEPELIERMTWKRVSGVLCVALVRKIFTDNYYQVTEDKALTREGSTKTARH